MENKKRSTKLIGLSAPLIMGVMTSLISCHVAYPANNRKEIEIIAKQAYERESLPAKFRQFEINEGENLDVSYRPQISQSGKNVRLIETNILPNGNKISRIVHIGPVDEYVNSYIRTFEESMKFNSEYDYFSFLRDGYEGNNLIITVVDRVDENNGGVLILEEKLKLAQILVFCKLIEPLVTAEDELSIVGALIRKILGESVHGGAVLMVKSGLIAINCIGAKGTNMSPGEYYEYIIGTLSNQYSKINDGKGPSLRKIYSDLYDALVVPDDSHEMAEKIRKDINRRIENTMKISDEVSSEAVIESYM